MKLLLLSFLFCIISIVSCKNATEATKASTVPGQDTVNVFLLQDTEVNKKLELPAELLPLEQSALYARVQGYVKEILVDIGDKVHKGQTLSIIEAPELQSKSAEFQASLQSARAKYQSSTDLYQRLYKASLAKTPGIVAPVDLVRSRNQELADSAAFESAKKAAQAYKDVAGFLVIQSPFDGIVTARNVDRGALVGNNQMVVTVQNNAALRLRVAVPELYISNIANEIANFRVDAYPEKMFEAKLNRKAGTIDPITRTELWEYRFDNKLREINAGTFAYIKLNLKRAGRSFVVPAGAIVTNQEKKFVSRIHLGKVEWVDIRQGMSTEKGIEIFGNLHNGDTLISKATDERKVGSEAFWKIVK